MARNLSVAFMIYHLLNPRGHISFDFCSFHKGSALMVDWYTRLISNILVTLHLSFVLFLPTPPQIGEGPIAPEHTLTSLCVHVACRWAERQVWYQQLLRRHSIATFDWTKSSSTTSLTFTDWSSTPKVRSDILLVSLKSTSTSDIPPQLFSGNPAWNTSDITDHYIVPLQHSTPFRSTTPFHSTTSFHSSSVPVHPSVPESFRLLCRTVSSLPLLFTDDMFNTYRLRPPKLRLPGRCRCPVFWHLHLFAFICI